MEKKEATFAAALAEAVANRDRLDDDRSDDKKARDRLKKRKEEGKVYDEGKLKKLNDAVCSANDDLARVRKNINDRKGWLKKVRRQVKKKARQLRNRRKPRIIDLNLIFRAMATQGGVDKVIGHYTAGPQDQDTEDAIRLCRIYHQAHLNNGWSGEGYMLNFTVDGDILLLRPAKYVGAHTLGYNTGSYGIMMHGTTGDTATKAQKRTLRWWAKNGHTARMGSGQTAVKPGGVRWYGHNDFNPTGCPGSFKPTYVSKGH